MSEFDDKLKAVGIVDLSNQITIYQNPDDPKVGHLSINDLYNNLCGKIENFNLVFKHQKEFKKELQKYEVSESGGSGINKNTSKDKGVANQKFEKHYVDVDESLEVVKKKLEQYVQNFMNKGKKNNTLAKQYPLPHEIIRRALQGKVLGLGRAMKKKVKGKWIDKTEADFKGSGTSLKALKTEQAFFQAQVEALAGMKLIKELKSSAMKDKLNIAASRKEVINNSWSALASYFNMTNKTGKLDLGSVVRCLITGDISQSIEETYSPSYWKSFKPKVLDYSSMLEQL